MQTSGATNYWVFAAGYLLVGFLSGYYARGVGTVDALTPDASQLVDSVVHDRGQNDIGSDAFRAVTFSEDRSAMPSDPLSNVIAESADRGKKRPAKGASAPERLTAIEALLEKNDVHSQRKLSREMQGLVAVVKADPDARKLVLDRLISAAGSPLGETLASILSATNDPEVESTAVRLAQEGYSTEQRVAVLALLSQSQSQAPETRAALVELLRTDTGAEEQVTLGALSALTRRGAAAPNFAPWDAEWGQRYATLHDPDNNPVDLYAPLSP